MENVISFFQSVSKEIVGGALALICAIAGARIASHSVVKQDRERSLRDAYADVFAGYYACVVDPSEKNLLLMVTALERALLICSSKSAELMLDIMVPLVGTPSDVQKASELIQKLRESAKEDVRNTKRK